MDVPDGTYRVTVTVGDPAAAAGSQTINVEGVRAVERFVPTLSKPTRTKTVDVEVTDGRITIDPLYPNAGARAKLISVVVRRVLGDDPPRRPDRRP